METKYVIIAAIAVIMILVLLILIFLQLNPELVTPPGTVSGKVNGAVLSDIAGKTITLEQATPPAPGQTPLIFTTTIAADGTYSFTEVPVGTYRVHVAQINNANGTYYQAATSSVITVTAGATVTGDVTLVN